MAPSEDDLTLSSSSEEAYESSDEEELSESEAESALDNMSSATPATKNGSVLVPMALSGRSNAVSDSVDQIMNYGWKLVEESQKSEWEEKSKKFMKEAAEIRVKKLELLHEQAKLVLEAMKSAQK